MSSGNYAGADAVAETEATRDNMGRQSAPRIHAMDERPMIAEEKPRAEPEIIPPSRDNRQSRLYSPRIRMFVNDDRIRQIYVARLGPLGILLIALMIAILLTIMLVLALGAFLIWILVSLLVAAVIISGPLRRYFRRR